MTEKLTLATGLEVDVDEMVSAVRALAAENPNKIYEQLLTNCLYWHEEAAVPGCIVGCAGVRQGISPEDVKLWDSVGDVPMVFRGISHQKVDWLTEVQARQDMGNSWGRAVAEADEKYPLT